ncbi:MAG TPA: FTR1 family protein [Gemmatimonadales bacterium]|nr:FTR1 family protein [Gemmatimonadales bacterium]
MTTSWAANLAAQGDSLVVARRVTAAAALAAKEYAGGVSPRGTVIAPQEIDESKQFLDEAMLDVPGLPVAARAAADSGLRNLRGMLERTAPPESVSIRANTLVQRIAALAGGPLESFPSRLPSRARAVAVYTEQCIQCHGAAGRGDGPKGRHLTGPPAADLGDEAELHDVSPQDMYRKIAIGVAGTGMPEYAEALSAEDRWALTAYIMTFRAGQQRVLEGEGLYAAQCAGCHGSAGQGDGPLAATLSVRPPALADLAIQARFSDRALEDLIRTGRPGTPMPGFARQLDTSATQDVVAFLRTLPLMERANASSSPQASVFSAVRRQIDSAVTLRSSKIAFDAYMTFEQVETDVRAHNAALTGDLEDAFAALRERAATASPEDLASIRARLFSGLERAERIVSDRNSTANLFTESFFLLLREGFEAILIIGALMAFLAKAGATERRRDVAKGAWAAVAASLATAVVVEMLFEITPGQREALEGVTMLIATGVLFYVSYWLFSKIEAAKWNAFVKGRMTDALSRGSSFALASVAFLAVYREGFETILFYKALLTSAGGSTGSGGTTAVLAGVLAASLALVVVYIAINRFGVRIPMRPFFAVTSTMLYYMAFVFAGKGIADLQEAGVVPMTVLEWAPRAPFLGIYPTLESLALQGLLVVLLLFALAWLERDRRLTTREPVPGAGGRA